MIRFLNYKCSSVYKADEIIWGAKLVPILDELVDGSIKVEVNRISKIKTAELPFGSCI